MKAENIEISKLENNTGQIKGLPKNPRTIRDERYKKLVDSLKTFPEMLSLRELIVFPFGKKYVVIAGNQRLIAGKELKFKEMPCKILDAKTTIEKLKRITILDNVGFGEDDWEALTSDWDAVELLDWGLELDQESPENKEISFEVLGSEMVIKLKYSEKVYKSIKAKLEAIDEDAGKAVIKLLNGKAKA